ncbi:MAG: hypothetical protein GX306_12075 [Clostridiales bacterium]|nr:hypothetical protein [Clostridiales bacterium]
MITLSKEKGAKLVGVLPNRTNRTENREEQWLQFLKKGQQITGVVVQVDQQVTLNFHGQKLSFSQEVLKDAVHGEEMIFEVTGVDNQTIELMRINEAVIEGNRQVATILRLDKDKETFLTQKEKSYQESRKEKEINNTKAKMQEIASKITKEDLKLLEEAGFSVDQLPIENLYNILNYVRVMFGEGKSANVSNPIYLIQTESTEKQIAARLAAENLPVTKDAVNKIAIALNFSEIVQQIDDRTIKSLIANDKEPTIANIYKAYYSGDFAKQEQKINLQPEAWQELLPQVTDTIEDAGYELDQENLMNAKWLIENQLPLTKNTITYKKELDTIRSETTKEIILDKIVEAMKIGVEPMDTSLASSGELAYEKLAQDMASIQDDTLVYAVKENKELTIKNLVSLQDQFSNTNPSEGDQKKEVETTGDIRLMEESLELIKARRQLEEIRLKMTREAAIRLEKQGIRIETERLEKLVDELRELENSYHINLLEGAEVEASPENIQILKETTQSIEQLRKAPEYILGATLSKRRIVTIPNLLEEGSKLQTRLMEAGEAYETMMTVPNREYGDSLQKAFRNLDSLLDEMNIENTAINQRAVRILAYNSMEIHEENLAKIKAYDLEVTSLIENMHPAITLKMIREGFNPLEIPVHELNQILDRMKEEEGIQSIDKFSTYLYKLERGNQINPEERKAYIGIYRLLHNIDKTDGAALGAVLKAGQEVTLNHLLTAVRTRRKGHIDSKINDEFGVLESLSFDEETITDQLDYMNRIIKQLKDEVSPEKMYQVQQEIAGELQAGGEVSSDKPSAFIEGGTWETIKDLPVEKLYELISRADDTQALEDEIYESKLLEIQSSCKNSEQAIRFLNEFKLPNNVTNILLASQLLSNKESSIKKLLKTTRENIVENSENKLKEMKDLTDTLIDKESMNKAYEELEQKAWAYLEQTIDNEVIDARILAERKSIAVGMSFLKLLAQKEFYRIPIETDHGITNINLTIIRGSDTSGKVGITIHSNYLGNVKAEFTLKNKKAQGYISCDNRQGLEELQKKTERLNQFAMEAGLEPIELDFITQGKRTEEYHYQNRDKKNQDGVTQSNTEQQLYSLARAMVLTVQSVERAQEN